VGMSASRGNRRRPLGAEPVKPCWPAREGRCPRSLADVQEPVFPLAERKRRPVPRSHRPTANSGEGRRLAGLVLAEPTAASGRGKALKRPASWCRNWRNPASPSASTRRALKLSMTTSPGQPCRVHPARRPGGARPRGRVRELDMESRFRTRRLASLTPRGPGVGGAGRDTGPTRRTWRASPSETTFGRTAAFPQPGRRGTPLSHHGYGRTCRTVTALSRRARSTAWVAAGESGPGDSAVRRGGSHLCRAVEAR